MSSTSGYIGAKYFQEFGPRLLACHVPNIARHGVSISCVSINSVSCHVILLRVSVSVPCLGHPEDMGGSLFRGSFAPFHVLLSLFQGMLYSIRISGVLLL